MARVDLTCGGWTHLKVSSLAVNVPCQQNPAEAGRALHWPLHTVENYMALSDLASEVTSAVLDIGAIEGQDIASTFPGREWQRICGKVF